MTDRYQEVCFELLHSVWWYPSSDPLRQPHTQTLYKKKKKKKKDDNNSNGQRPLMNYLFIYLYHRCFIFVTALHYRLLFNKSLYSILSIFLNKPLIFLYVYCCCCCLTALSSFVTVKSNIRMEKKKT